MELTAIKDVKRLLAFGTGAGIEIGAQDLTVVVTRVRPKRVRVLGRLVIEDFASRPAAEWGGEYARFLKSVGAERVCATVLLPRRDVIVRHAALPGVKAKDIDGALRFQLDTLHPYGDEDVVWAWSPLAYGNVLVGIVRRETVDRYVTLFSEAGIAVSSFTFSAAAVHAAVRVNPQAPPKEGFVAVGRAASGAVEVYGESQSRPVFHAEFNVAPERAAALVLSELRLAPDTPTRTLEEVLPKPEVNPVENDLSRNARPYATALAGACPRLAPAANVLPPEHRQYSSRAVFIPSVALAALILMVAGSMAAYASWSEKRYLQTIQAEINRLDPLRRRAETLERQTQQARARAQLLDKFRRQTRSDLDALNEITRLVEPPAWLNMLQLVRDGARLGGFAPQSAALVTILDGSTFFEKSETLSSSGVEKGESFQIHTTRRSGK
jgi:hypothetical protein